MPEISVIIPVYNKEKYIQNTLESVLRQTFTDFEIIIIDDGSTDDSMDIATSFKHPAIRIFRQKNQGVSMARNKGASLAKGNILAFLDADDLWLPEHLETLKKLSNKYPEAGFFATAYSIRYNHQLKKDFIGNFDKTYHLIPKFYQYSYEFPLFFTSNFAITKEVFLKTGGFKTGIHAEDTEYFLRLAYRNLLGYATKITMIHLHKTENSLATSYSIDKKTQLLKSFTQFEKEDSSLKKYLDINRYIWAVEYLINGEKNKAQNLIRDIDLKNLNKKQRFLLRLRGNELKLLKNIQNFLLAKGIHLTVQS